MKSIHAALPLIAGLAILAGCMSVPLSTVAKISQFNRESFVAMKPEDLRVKITVPQGFVIDPSSTHIRVRMKEEGKEEAGIDGAIELRLLQSSPVTKSAGLFRSEISATEFELVLTEKGQQLLRDLQKSARREGRRTLTISVNKSFLKSFLKRPPQARSLNYWIELQLTRLDGYMVLVDGARFDLQEAERAGM